MVGDPLLGFNDSRKLRLNHSKSTTKHIFENNIKNIKYNFVFIEFLLFRFMFLDYQSSAIVSEHLILRAYTMIIDHFNFIVNFFMNHSTKLNTGGADVNVKQIFELI